MLIKRWEGNFPFSVEIELEIGCRYLISGGTLEEFGRVEGTMLCHVDLNIANRSEHDFSVVGGWE